MIVREIGRFVIAGVLLSAPPAAPAAPQLTCDQIVALSRFAGGKASADDLAKRLQIDAETVRRCLATPGDTAKGTRAAAPPAPK